MLSQIKSGDVVWDIGANTGFYTGKFIDKVGPGGVVVCFEPASACFRLLTQKYNNLNNLCLENVAVGSEDGEGYLSLDENPLAATHQVACESNMIAGSRNMERISIVSGDSYREARKITPNVIKIDVEGYEEEVLLGMKRLVHSSKLRAIFCEVHFSLLEERGKKMAPFRIEKFLLDAGYQTTWLDLSHLQAVR